MAPLLLLECDNNHALLINTPFSERLRTLTWPISNISNQEALHWPHLEEMRRAENERINHGSRHHRGATGAGIMRDCALRGIDLHPAGAGRHRRRHHGRNHGLLHSGLATR